MAQTPEEVSKPFEEAGVAGYRHTGGWVTEDFLPQLNGKCGTRTYRQMKDNDATIASILFAIDMIIRSIDWTVEIAEDEDGENIEAEGQSLEGDEAVRFLESVLFDDMEITFDDFIAEVISFLPFGWSYFETIFKRRNGPNEMDKKQFSNFSDGRIGIRKLGLRPQETLWKWDLDENGEILGMQQQPPNAGNIRNIPMSKGLLFRAAPNKGSPEGRSILRSAYRSWYQLRNIQEIESIAIERETVGLPIVYVPGSIIRGETPEAKVILDQYESMVKNVRLNEQGGLVLPSDVYKDGEGNPTSQRKYEFKLTTSGGQRSIDTNTTIVRYQTDIARTVLAQFIMLGASSRGSFALSKDQTELFETALTGWLEMIATTINRCLVPRLWKLNGWSTVNMPFLKPGIVGAENLAELGAYIQQLSAAGAPLFPDDDLESALREAAGLPPKGPDAMSVDDASLDGGGIETDGSDVSGTTSSDT